jgi:hypothetical protein
MTKRIGPTSLPPSLTVKLWIAAIISAAAAWALKLGVPTSHRMVMAIAILALYGFVYLIITTSLGIGEATAMTARITRRRSA